MWRGRALHEAVAAVSADCARVPPAPTRGTRKPRCGPRMRSASCVEEPVLVHDGVTSARVTQALHADGSWPMGMPDSGGNAPVTKDLKRDRTSCAQPVTSGES